MACASASLLIVLGWQAASFGYGPHAAAIAASAAISADGGSLTISGQNFLPDEAITLTLDGVIVGSARANGSGSFSTSITIPSDTSPGKHSIIATGASGDSASTAITVEILPTTPAPHVAGPTTPAPHVAASGSGPSAAKTLQVSRHTLVPGQPTVISGRGCAPGALVVVSIEGKEVELTRADSQGAFSASLAPPGGVGQVTVTATCGSKKFVAVLTLVTTAKVSAPAGSVAAFGTFVLLGGLLVRGQFGTTSRRGRRKHRGASDVLKME